jgi:predicted lipoprotein with Yx(FWY)xxD motif
LLRRALLPIAVAGIVLTISACGGSGGGASTPTGPAMVGTTNTGALGTFLVGPDGKSLYLFEADTGPQSTCSDQCANDWPPLLTAGSPTAGAGAMQAVLGTTARSDGTTQVTYHGHPLYYYGGDSKVGDTNGQGLNQYGAGWDVVSPAGDKIEK